MATKPKQEIRKAPGRGADKFPLRLPDGLRDRIKAAAAANSRTMNAELVERVEYSMPGGKFDRDFAEVIGKLEAAELATFQAHGEVRALQEKVEALERDRRYDREAIDQLTTEANKSADEWLQLNVETGRQQARIDALARQLEASRAEVERLTAANAKLTRQLEDTEAELAGEKVARMGAEANAELFHTNLLHIANQRDDLQGRLEATETELRSAEKARDEALSRAKMLDHMFDLLRQMDNHRKEDRIVLDELEEIAKFLEGDLVVLHMELTEPDAPKIVTPAPKKPTTFLAERIAMAIDGRMIRMMNLISRLANHKALRRAKVFAHHVSLTDIQRELCQMLVDDGTPGTADDFYDFVEANTDAMPEESAAGDYKAALPGVMQMIFKGWERHPTGDTLSAEADRPRLRFDPIEQEE